MLKVSILEHTLPSDESTDLGFFRDFKTKKEFGGTSSFAEFLNKRLGNQGYYNKHLKRVEEKLGRIKEYLISQNYRNTDPIKYLGYLYHEESLSTRDISKRLSSIGISYSASGLGHLFKETLGWEMRENFDEENPITKRKNSHKIGENHGVMKGKKVFLEKKKKEIGEKVKQLLDSSLDQYLYQFGREDYKNLRTDFEKIAYVLNIYYTKPVYNLIEDLKDEGMKAPTIATLINSLCKELLLINEPTIREFPETSKNTIAYILNKKTPK